MYMYILCVIISTLCLQLNMQQIAFSTSCFKNMYVLIYAFKINKRKRDKKTPPIPNPISHLGSCLSTYLPTYLPTYITNQPQTI